MKAIKFSTIATLAATLAGAASLAHAAIFNFDHDSADLVHQRASFVFGAMNWGQEVGGTQIQGKLTGALTYHGVVAGCAKVRVIWRNSAGNEISRDLSGEACSNSSAPSVPINVGELHLSSSLRGARVELQLKEFNQSGFGTVLSRSMQAGGG